MKSFDARLRAWTIWLAPFIVVALLLGWETNWGRTLKRVPAIDAAVQPQPVAVALLPEFALPAAADARRDTVERTLFNPTRRPAPPAPPVLRRALRRPASRCSRTPPPPPARSA